MLRLIPPAGTPVRIGDISRALAAWLVGRDNGQLLTEKLFTLLGDKQFFFVSSGRVGLYLILKGLSELSGGKRDEVIIPSYTCFSVAAAIKRAGFKIHPVDMIAERIDYNYAKLSSEINEKTLAVISCNLFGILSDMDRLRAITTNAGAFLVDDAAQSFGSLWNGEPSGTIGDAGFISLDRGKNMTAYSGGVIVTGRDDLAEIIKPSVSELARPGMMSNLKTALMLCVYGRLLYPRAYWLPATLPFLGLGETSYNENFGISRLGSFQLAAAGVNVDQLDTNNRTRKKNAQLLIEALESDQRYTIAGYRDRSLPVYLRLPLLCKDRNLRDKALQSLRKNGIQASGMYPSIIVVIPAIESEFDKTAQDFPGGEKIVDRLLVLPTHPYLKQRDILKIVNTLSDL